MSPPEVSVVLPVRNGAATIDRQLVALSRSRTSRRWELLVSDNGSTDDTLARVATWYGRLPLLRTVDSGDRPGVAHARNAGVRVAAGRIILHCDADDAVRPDWLDTLAAATDHADVVGGAIDRDPLNPARCSACGVSATEPGRLQHGPFEAGLGATLGYRREVFDEIGGFDPDFGPGVAEDVEFCWRAQVHSFQFAYVPEAVIDYAERRELPALARQYFQYGRGMRQLERRFAQHTLPGGNDVVGRRRNAVVLLRRQLRPCCRREFLRRIAWSAGAAYATRSDPVPKPIEALLSDAAMRERPLVTAGVTAFDAVHTIERAVRSAAAQTWQPLEIVVVDDASTDGTAEVLARLEDELAGLRLVRHERNLGVAAARNTVLAEARGEFVAFFDDDDRSHPERIERQVARLEQHEQRFGTDDPVLCHTARTIVGPDGATAYLGVAGADPLHPPAPGQRLVEHLLQGRPLPGEPMGSGATCAQLGRACTYRLLGGFDPTLRRADDTELNVRLGAAGGGHIGVAEPLVEQHISMGPDKGVAADGAASLALLAKHRELLPDSATYVSCRRWVLARIALLQGQRRAGVSHLAVAFAVKPVALPRRLIWVLSRMLRTRFSR